MHFLLIIQAIFVKKKKKLWASLRDWRWKLTYDTSFIIFFSIYAAWRRGSIVTVVVVTGKEGGWRNRGLNGGRLREFLLLQNIHTVSRAQTPSYLVGTWGLFPWGKAAGAWNGTLLYLVPILISYGVPVRERYGSTLLPATREQHDQNCTQSH